MMDTGTGVVVTDPSVIMNGKKGITDTEITNNNQDNLVTLKIKDKDDGVDKVKYISSTANVYKHTSELARANLSIFQFQWHYCNPELLYPGMAVGFIYNDVTEGTIVLRGILQSVYYKYSTATQTLACILNVMMEKPTNIKKENV